MKKRIIVDRSGAAAWAVTLATSSALIAGCGGGAEPASDASGTSVRPLAVAVSSAQTPSNPSPWLLCSQEHQRCQFTGIREVKYGTTTAYVTKTYTGGVTCQNAEFGDPAVGIVKSCWTRSTTAVATPRDAARLAQQATFGNTESLALAIQSQGPAAWIKAQMALSSSRYTRGGDDSGDRIGGDYICNRAGYAGVNCWRDWLSTVPLEWDFYRNALQQPDQLRQRVAFALQQIVVTSGLTVDGTYGHRAYQNRFLADAFSNYRQVLTHAALSPVMGEYLNNVNNDKAAPNENFAREMLQLFSLGTCMLNADGSLQGGKCLPTYTNETVRAYAYSLTGWTYPTGGAVPASGCWPQGANCRYLAGDMVAVPRFRDLLARSLMSGVSVPANTAAPQAFELVMDSLMQHPNMAPFVSRGLIQQLVTSNPSASYVSRVASAFISGKYTSGDLTFGTGQRGDLAATVASILLDTEARGSAPSRSTGILREPVLMWTGVLRALNGKTDGDPFTFWWGETLQEHVFRSPSVFNFYPTDYPVVGTALNGPTFALQNASTSLDRLNFLSYMIYYGGFAPSASVPAATGTSVDLSAFQADAANAATLVDRLAVLATGAVLPDATRTIVITAVNSITSADGSTWLTERVKQAAYLVFASPNFQVER